MKKKMSAFCILMLLCIAPAFAQQSVTGQVFDESSEPLIGASVVVKGTNNGVITDFDGNFILSASPGETLLVSYVGFDSQEVEIPRGGGALKSSSSRPTSH